MPISWDSAVAHFLSYRNTGSVENYEALYQTLLPVLNRYFFSRTRSQETAEDLTQATLLKIHFSRDRFDPSQSFKTWLFTIASRTLIDLWRSHPAEREIDTGESESIADSTDLEGAVINQVDLNVALKELKPIDSTIVYLYGVEGLSMAEIAKSLGMSENAVKLRAHRSYKRLRELIAFLLMLLGMGS